MAWLATLWWFDLELQYKGAAGAPYSIAQGRPPRWIKENLHHCDR